MILLISGSRSLDDTEIFKRAMHEFLQSKFGEDYSAHLPLNSIIDQIVSGNAKGVDAAGERFAKKHGIDLVLFPANWEKHGKAALSVVLAYYFPSLAVPKALHFTGNNRRKTRARVERARARLHLEAQLLWEEPISQQRVI